MSDNAWRTQVRSGRSARAFLIGVRDVSAIERRRLAAVLAQDDAGPAFSRLGLLADALCMEALAGEWADISGDTPAGRVLDALTADMLRQIEAGAVSPMDARQLRQHAVLARKLAKWIDDGD